MIWHVIENKWMLAGNKNIQHVAQLYNYLHSLSRLVNDFIIRFWFCIFIFKLLKFLSRSIWIFDVEFFSNILKIVILTLQDDSFNVHMYILRRPQIFEKSPMHLCGGDFAKFCGLLRIYELYKSGQLNSWFILSCQQSTKETFQKWECRRTSSPNHPIGSKLRSILVLTHLHRCLSGSQAYPDCAPYKQEILPKHL